MLEPEYAGLLEMALALADGQDRDAIHDLSAFALACRAIAGQIAGRPVSKLNPVFAESGLPEAMIMALDALFTGVQLGLSS